MEHYKYNRSGGLGAFLSGVLAAVAVGGFMLFGSKNARRNRQKVEDWVEDAKAEVENRARRIRRITRDKYNEIADTVSDKYARMKDVGKEKADKLRDEIKGKWDEVERRTREEEEEER